MNGKTRFSALVFVLVMAAALLAQELALTLVVRRGRVAWFKAPRA
jgi:hypothetical protein